MKENNKVESKETIYGFIDDMKLFDSVFFEGKDTYSRFFANAYILGRRKGIKLSGKTEKGGLTITRVE
ncbi:MAG TPA: hypothetical protein VFV43_01545 [Limnobacter sp.]|nr:hypothetical protein [Limnobacter sp.]